MSSSPHTQAILLLTSHFSKNSVSDVKPLTPKEWGRFALWLKDHDVAPEMFLQGNTAELMQGWTDKKITVERIDTLMNRGSALALTLEKWFRAGLWVITRADPEYPIQLKRRLGIDSPAALYGCGNRELLNTGGIAVVGSRNVSEDDIRFSKELARVASENGHSIISGGAKGVDEASMLGALDAEGHVIGVLADSLLRAASSAKYRRHLLSRNLVLISPFYPEAGFNVGNAMQRNKYIYCLSDTAIVVHSGKKGGTWTGAHENLKKRWVPLSVKETKDDDSGNQGIVDAGGQWISSDISKLDFSSLFSQEDNDHDHVQAEIPNTGTESPDSSSDDSKLSSTKDNQLSLAL